MPTIAMPTLNWIGKEAVVKHHKEVPFRLLEPVHALDAIPIACRKPIPRRALGVAR